MKHKTTPLFQTLVISSLLIGTSHAALVASFDVESPTDIKISISGSIDGPEPSVGAGAWLFILTNPLSSPAGVDTYFNTNAAETVGTDTLAAGSVSLSNAYLSHALGGVHNIQLNFSGSLAPGTVISGSQTLRFDNGSGVGHGLAQADFQDAQIYYGYASGLISNGVPQTSSTEEPVSTPEPSTSFLFGLGALGILCRRSRKA